jgi:hypothetical protein
LRFFEVVAFIVVGKRVSETDHFSSMGNPGEAMARHKIRSSFMAALKPPASGRLEIFDQLLPAFGLRISFTGQFSWFVFFRMRGRLLADAGRLSEVWPG